MNLNQLTTIATLQEMTTLSIKELSDGAQRIHHHARMHDGTRISISIFNE